MNNTTTTFTYGGDGLRNSRTMGGVTTTFTWDIAGGLPVVLDDGAQYVYGAGLVSQVSGANSYYYLADGLGSTMKTVDASGAVVNGYTYDIYGKKTSSTGSQANEFDFAGQQTDPTGLQYLRARYYDPETGTFMSREPLAVLPIWPGAPYGYADSNPADKVDPTGLYPIDSDGCRTDRRDCPERQGSVPASPGGWEHCAYAPQGFAPAGQCSRFTPTEDGPAGTSLKDIVGRICVSAGFCVGGATYVIDGVRFWDGQKGQKEAFKRYKNMGQPEYQSRNKLHALKRQNGVGAKEDLAFDENGNVYRRVFQGGKEFLDDLGNILDDTFGPGLK